MTANELLNAYAVYAQATEQADAAFDLANFPNLPERPAYTADVQAGELIHERGLRGALTVALAGIEDTECSERVKDAYALIIEAAR